MEDLFQAIHKSVLEGDAKNVVEKTQEALKAGITADKLLNESLIAAMAEVGRLYEEGEFFVPEMLIAARAMQSGLDLLKPLLAASDIQPRGKIVAGTVRGDLHDIGKNLVCMMLEGNGFEIIDLGTDVSAEQFVESVRSTQANMVAISTLLTTTMPNIKNVITALQEAGLRNQVKIMVGGAPVTDTFAQQVGADGYAPDASQAVALAQHLLN